MEYLFILGRNPELSIMELKSFFKRENNKILNIIKRRNAVIIESENELKKVIIDKLGGSISIGNIIAKGNIKDIKKKIDREMIYKGERNKFNYVIWDFCNDEFFSEISEYLKKRFREEKLKTTEKKIGGIIKLQSGKIVENLRSNLIEEEFFVFSDNDEDIYFGRIIEKCNYEDIEKRDIEKPIRREALSISPRLAKIMINLSEIEKGKLADPFCGIGVILFEALLQDIQVIGIDKDKNAIEGANKNLDFGKFNKKNYEIISGDSRKIKIKDAEVIVCEPELGSLIKKVPKESEAKETIRNFENLIIQVINNLKNNVSGRIVFTSPFIQTIKGRVFCNAESIANRTNLNLVEGFPIKEFREGQIVGREIFVLEK